MGARQKLNRAYVNGAFLLSAIAGFVTESWFWFFFVFIACLAGSYYDGEIRTGPRRRRLNSTNLFESRTPAPSREGRRHVRFLYLSRNGLLAEQIHKYHECLSLAWLGNFLTLGSFVKNRDRFNSMIDRRRSSRYRADD